VEWQMAMLAKMDEKGWNLARLAKELGVSRTTATNLLSRAPDQKGSALVEPASRAVGLKLLPLHAPPDVVELFERIMEVKERWPEQYKRIVRQAKAAAAQIRDSADE
jgi:hypothetical protein